MQSRVCWATAELYRANFRESLLFGHSFTKTEDPLVLQASKV